MRKLWEWIKSFFINTYVLKVYFVTAELETENGLKKTTKTSKEYHLKAIHKKTQRHIIATDVDGNIIEIQSITPFDFTLIKMK